MILSGHQPTFLPWGGYVAKYAACDEWVEMDSAQFERGSFQNRNYVRTRDGRAVLLTVPVEHNGKPVATRDLKIAQDSRWRRKHIETLRQCYGKTPGWEEYGPFWEETYEWGWDWLLDFTMRTTGRLTDALGVSRGWVFLGDDDLMSACSRARAHKINRLWVTTTLAEMELAAPSSDMQFIFGEHGPDYVNVEEWKATGVEPIFTTYQNPEWLTARTPEGKVVPVTAWDAVFRFGTEKLSEITGGLSVRDPHQASLVRLRAS